MTREELYRLVWETPAVHVARRLGLANGTFRALCDTYNIPLPPAGYWTKRAHGQSPEPAPLPDAAPKFLKKINLALRNISDAAIDITDAQIADYTLGETGATGTALDEPCAFVDALDRAFADAPADGAGFKSLVVPDVIALEIAQSNRARVLAFIGRLIAAARKLGFAVPDGGARGLAYEGERFFALRLYDVRPDQARLRGDGGTNAAGRLCLEIYDPRSFQWRARNLVGHWHDRKERPLERSIPIALGAAVNAAPLIRQARAAALGSPKE